MKELLWLGLFTFVHFTEGSNLQERATSRHEVELLIVADYSAYKNWYDKTPTTDTSQTRQSAAKNNLKAYIGSLIKSSNIVYKSLESSNIFVQIKLVDVVVMTRASDSPWTETVKVRASPKYRVDPNKVLPLFKPKSVELQSTIPHDHAMVFTMYALDHGDNHTFSGITIVLVYTPTHLHIMLNSIYYTILGCDHDGDGNSCNSKDGYAMATNFILANVKKWTFSSCSVNYIQTYISSLDKQHRDCLLSSQNRHPDPYVLNTTSLWYGQRYSADEQCRVHYGEDSYLCRDRYYKDYTTICLKLKCYDAKRDSCYYIDGGDGTPCGNKKWCISDVCVHDDHAPSVSDSCPVGDQTGVVKNGMTCKQLVSSDPNECYAHGIKYKCCSLCAGSDQHGNTISIDQQCVKRHGQGSYLCRGTHRYSAANYSSMVCSDLMCNDPTRSNWCLSSSADDRTTCGDKKWCINKVCVHDIAAPTMQDSCPFGDQSTGIAAHGLTCAQIKHPEHHWRCYDDHTRKKCCETCQSILRNDKGCEYGDKSDWCQTNIASQNDKQMCYWGHNADLCCGSCSKYGNMAHHGCEYGDKQSGCVSSRCSHYSSSHRGKCCETCLSAPVIG
ncbi:A disintegrin and metalloproteinase with thrombospondin motifs 3-like [Mytilus trossulus]|uniref:A disintegrin and metalloproteinase with thrombospondin motifs 3-like n=1 Tax=Mytilus trossulus TaxID=6551 RepID=UPI003007EA3E